jgi:hypothetical protein
VNPHVRSILVPQAIHNDTYNKDATNVKKPDRLN